MRTVTEIWNEYAKVLPHNVGPVQARETKRAFLSGMLAFDAAMNELETLPDGQDIEALNRIKQDLMYELLKFIREDFPGEVN